MSPLSGKKNISQESPPLESLPAELRLEIFRHVHAHDSKVQIPENGKIPSDVAENLANTMICSSLQHWAREAYLESLTWSFESIEAASCFVGAEGNAGILRNVWRVSIDGDGSEAGEVLKVLERGGVGLRSVEVRGDVGRVFGLGGFSASASSGRQGALPAMQGDEDEVLGGCFERSCKVMDVLDRETFDPQHNPLLRVLAGFSALERVVMEARCQLCVEHDLECDWRSAVRRAELYALMGNRGCVSAGRRQRVRELEGEVARSTEEFENSQRSDSVIGPDCGMELEDDLESDEELALLMP